MLCDGLQQCDNGIMLILSPQNQENKNKNKIVRVHHLKIWQL